MMCETHWTSHRRTWEVSTDPHRSQAETVHSLHAERDLKDMASQPEAAAGLDLDRLRRVDALNGYGICQEGAHACALGHWHQD